MDRYLIEAIHESPAGQRLGCSGACSETTVTADGRAAAVGGGTVRERDWLFDGHARIGEALDD